MSEPANDVNAGRCLELNANGERCIYGQFHSINHHCYDSDVAATIVDEINPMKKRIHVGGKLFVGMFSRRVYWAPRVTAEPHGEGTATFRVLGKKHDVTTMFEECARELGWTPPSKEDEE